MTEVGFVVSGVNKLTFYHPAKAVRMVAYRDTFAIGGHETDLKWVESVLNVEHPRETRTLGILGPENHDDKEFRLGFDPSCVVRWKHLQQIRLWFREADLRVRHRQGGGSGPSTRRTPRTCGSSWAC